MILDKIEKSVSSSDSSFTKKKMKYSKIYARTVSLRIKLSKKRGQIYLQQDPHIHGLL